MDESAVKSLNEPMVQQDMRIDFDELED